MHKLVNRGKLKLFEIIKRKGIYYLRLKLYKWFGLNSN